MKRLIAAIFLVTLGAWAATVAAVAAIPSEIPLTSGWRITQDVRELGEQTEWFKPEYAADWQPIDRLAHLQLLLAEQPYFGRSLRHFNIAPWWYRLEFPTPEIARQAVLKFEGVDYFAKVWLNGTLLGEHEGYADPFEFEVAKLLRKDRPNVLVVKVSSPWDKEYADPKEPIVSVVRNMLKGSYEHADTFVHRDVNPIGIWRPVSLTFHDELRQSDLPTVSSSLSADQRQASVKAAWPVFNDGPARSITYAIRIREQGTKKEVATQSKTIRLAHGANALEVEAVIPAPKLWTTWDRGSQPLYEATLELAQSGAAKLSSSVSFGVRTSELRRSANETRFFINGKPLYLRGTTYWPDLYLSNMSRARYERDIQAAMRAGMNAFRVHVHTENPEFYELCDKYGIAVIQDTDLNWVFPTDAAFSARAVQHFSDLITLLRKHPSIIGWVAMNEVGLVRFDENYLPVVEFDKFKELGAQLLMAANKLDPTRPVILNSAHASDLASGDMHDYRGTLFGGTSKYFDIFNSKDKLSTEFGVDAPPAIHSLRAIPEAAERLKDVLPRVSELHDYQYRILKYFIEHYRIQKYAPNAGYFQFMWIDLSPQSFYGVYDYWGIAKTEGLGGGLRALQEANQPIGIFMEHHTKPVALHAVNDSSVDLGHCTAQWRVMTGTEVIAEGSQAVTLGSDSHQRIRDFDFPVKKGGTYEIVLDLVGPDGKVLAHNTYMNPFTPQERPKGHPERMDDELGMRLWWAQ